MFDVGVVGGGPAGLAAALAAARAGAGVILIERYGFVGGCATMPMPILGLKTSGGEPLVGGIALEILDRLRELGGCTEIFTHPTLQSFCSTNGDLLKVVADRMLAEAGVTRLLHTTATGVRSSGRRISGIAVRGKEGAADVPVRFVIDASGDAEVAAAAGVPTVVGRSPDGQVQSVTVQFTVGKVDLSKTRAYLGSHPEDSVYPVGSADSMRLFMGFQSQVSRAKKQGILSSYPRDYLIFHQLLEENQVGVNTTKMNCLALDSAALTAAETEGRSQAMQVMATFTKLIPGFERAVFMSFPPQVGVRETRRIVGRYTLTLDDVVRGRKTEDGIALSRYPVDIHDPVKEGPVLQQLERPYHVPFACLVPASLDNLLAAGRCISASHEAIASARVMGTCMAMGQAAGVAAAQCFKNAVPAGELSPSRLRGLLTEQGAIL